MTFLILVFVCAPFRFAQGACPGDCDGSGEVTFNDLIEILTQFGSEGPVECDADGSQSVEFNDLVTALSLFGPCPASSGITMDGSFDDWSGIAPSATDALGDASGGFDITEVRVASRGTTVFVRFDISNVLNLQAGGFLDGTLLISVTGPSGDVFEVDTRGREYTLTGEGSVGHAAAGYFALPTYASEQYEARIDASIVGASTGDEVTIRFGGSDELDAPITHTLEPADGEAFVQSIDRADGTDLRVANLNVLSRGLTDPDRSDEIHSLIRGVDADVYCFQEQWNGSASTVRNAMAQAFAGFTDGREDPSNWNVSIENGAAIATTMPFEAMSVPGSREGGGIVTLDDGTRVFVLSIHLKCCGSIGSGEDVQRINATTAYESFFQSLCEDEPGLGIIVTGDWNLVGSRTPLDILTDSSDLGLTDLPLLRATQRLGATWRNPGSSFTPGRLDLMVYSPAVFDNARGFILDTTELGASTLDENGLDADDSEASDHLMLVTDFGVGG